MAKIEKIIVPQLLVNKGYKDLFRKLEVKFN